MKKTILPFFVIACLFPIILPGQTSSRITHYSIKDGLPHNRISSIFQDSRGFIWLATLNGAAKFDGYEFTSYLNGSSQSYRVRNSRIRQIAEDHSGNMWFITYGGEIHRLNPFTDELSNVGAMLNEEKPTFNATWIKIVPSGTIWVISEKNGCVRLDRNTSEYHKYNTENGGLKGDVISSIHEDRQGNTWILTNNGLTFLEREEAAPGFFFEGNASTKQWFYSVLEWDDELWFGTDNGRVWRYEKGSENFDIFETGATAIVNHLIPWKNKQAIIGTGGDGLFVYNSTNGQITHYSSSNSGLRHDYIMGLWKDPYDNVWIHSLASGIARLDPEDNRIVHYESPPLEGNEHIFSTAFIRIDPERRVWVRLRDGLFNLYDPIKKTLTPFNETGFAPSGDYPSSVTNVFFDNQSNFWISSLKGLDKVTFSTNNFQIMKLAAGTATADNDVRALMEDKNGNIWIASKEPKIHIYSPDESYLGYLCADGSIGFGVPFSGMAYCMYCDLSGNIWVGTKGDGLYCLIKENNRFKVRNFKNDQKEIYSLNNNNIYSIQGDSQGRIWIGTWGGGLNLLDQQDDGSLRFIHHHNKLKNYPLDHTSFIRHIGEEKKGKIFVGTSMGLLVFNTDWEFPEQVVFRLYDQDGRAESILSSDIQYICQSSKGTYMATGGGGVSLVSEWDEDGFPASFKTYTRKDGLPSDNILSIVESENGKLWVCSEENITRFDPVTESFRNFDESNKLIKTALFSEASALLSHRTGKLLLGYSNGIIQFQPDELNLSFFVPSIVFTNLQLSNKDVPIGENALLSRHINETDRITLSHKEKVFSIGFAALDYNAPEDIKYAYMLEGFDPDWIHGDKQRSANYMNLPKGEYTLRVKSTNADGTWVDNERQLAITMLPSFWETGWAYVFYALLVLFFTVVGYYILYTIFRLRNQVRLESELAEIKLRFFTDISHEIRTPLTMITGPIDYLIHDKKTPKAIKKQLGFVSQNTQRMLRMINQILDLRKAQNGSLEFEYFQAGDFIGLICLNFSQLATEQQIDFTFEDSTAGALIWADKDAVEKIMFNLLSNAFKYTSPGKRIQVRIGIENEVFRLEVRDQGKGIEPGKLSLIFDRFFTIDPSENTASSGIGLSMVKELVHRHDGKVWAESIPGEGSLFVVLLNSHSGLHSHNSPHFQQPDTLSEHMKEKEGNTAAKKGRDSLAAVLVVEDDPDLRIFLESILISKFRVFKAENGIKGLDIANQIIPDLIVSDVMMPGMDGITLLKELKNNLNTSHIPVILLTAKGAIDNKLEGLEFGADDYIVKPFSVPYFQARIQNLLNQRKHLQDRYYSNFVLSERANTPVKVVPVDKNFLDQIIQDIESHLDDSDYSIDSLVKVSGLSRTPFFKKLKALTGMAPVELIREIRLQHAAKLLKTGQLRVKEVVYMVGFNDLKYFTNCFKAKYGQTPNQYKSGDMKKNDGMKDLR